MPKISKVEGRDEQQEAKEKPPAEAWEPMGANVASLGNKNPITLADELIAAVKDHPKGMHGELSVGQRLALLKLDAVKVLLRV